MFANDTSFCEMSSERTCVSPKSRKTESLTFTLLLYLLLQKFILNVNAIRWYRWLWRFVLWNEKCKVKIEKKMHHVLRITLNSLIIYIMNIQYIWGGRLHVIKSAEMEWICNISFMFQLFFLQFRKWKQ